MKGVFHLHTRYSYDSFVDPKQLVYKAKKKGLDLLIITDHDSLQGSIEASNIASTSLLQITIPIAGEFFTDVGDIIVVNVPPNFEPSFSHEKLCSDAKKQGGFTVLPHPYDAHKLEKIQFDLIDCIEVFNSRSSKENDLKAKSLSDKLNKPIIFGADAHFARDMMNCCFTYSGTFPHFHSITPQGLLIKTPPYRKSLSQMIKGIKQKDLPLTLRNGLNTLKHFFF